MDAKRGGNLFYLAAVAVDELPRVVNLLGDEGSVLAEFNPVRLGRLAFVADAVDDCALELGQAGEHGQESAALVDFSAA